jgi:hypothetical protein
LLWDNAEKSIKDLVGKMNQSNVRTIIRQLLQNNIVRGRVILVGCSIEAQFRSKIMVMFMLH